MRTNNNSKSITVITVISSLTNYCKLFLLVLFSLIINSFISAEPWNQTGGTVTDAAWTVDTAHVTGQTNVGALAGEGGVSGGSATYTVPIVIPPGRNGVQPSVSLNYSSRSGNGIAGVGWGLSAGSSVHRCSLTAAQDGVSRAVNYSTTDKLCLDGQRLMRVSGSSYGNNGAVYRTEQDNFTKVVQTKSINSTTSSFIVTFKDGTVNRYGTAAQSRHEAYGKSQILTWALEDSRDTSGNTIAYDYLPFGNGEYAIDAIHYSGYNGSDGDRHVRFIYETRPDISSSYLAGGLTRKTQRLKTIQTQYQSQLIREYKLTYTESAFSNRSLLSTITECASGNCLPATMVNSYNPTLAWDNNNSSSAPQQSAIGEIRHGDAIKHIDLNGDGKLEAIYVEIDAINASYSGSSGNSITSKIYALNPQGDYVLKNTVSNPVGIGAQGDLNGDGISDFFRILSNGQIQLVQFDQNYVEQNIAINLTVQKQTPDTAYQYAMDVNGDGYQDLVYKNSDSQIAYYENNADGTLGFNGPYLLSTLTQNYAVPAYTSTHESARIQDIDGDGILDIIRTRISGAANDEIKVDFGKYQNGHWAIGLTKTAAQLGLPTNNYANQYHYADINGDGLADFVRTVKSGSQYDWKVRFNKGNRTFASEQSLGTALGIHEHDVIKVGATNLDSNASFVSKVQSLWGGARFLDIDNDGKDELLVPTHSNDNLCVDFFGMPLSSGPSGPSDFGNDWEEAHQIVACNDVIQTNRKILRADTQGAAQGKKVSIDWAIHDIRRFQWSVVDFGMNTAGQVSVQQVRSDVVNAPLQSFTDLFTNRYSALQLMDYDNDGFIDFTYQTVDSWDFRSGQSPYNVIRVAGVPYQNAGISVNFQNGSPAIHSGYFQQENLTGKGNNLGKLADATFKITDGFENTRQWSYAPLSRHMIRNGSLLYDVPKEFSNRYIANDTNRQHFYFTSSMQVVSDFLSSNGIGGENLKQYSYREAVYNRSGRGIQGFRSITVDDLASGLRSVSDFHQLFPLSGNLDEVRTCLIADNDNECSNKPISKSEYDWQYWLNDTYQSPMPVTNAQTTLLNQTGARYFVGPLKTTAINYDYRSDQTQTSRPELFRKTNQSTFDVYGNVLTSTSTYHEPNNKNKNESITTTIYAPNESIWWINKPTSQTVLSKVIANRFDSAGIAAGTDHQKQVKTAFNNWDDNHRKPKSVTTSVIQGGGHSTTVSTEYNMHGLPTSVTMIGKNKNGSNLAARTTNTTYSPDGYFLKTVTNAKGHVTTTETDPKFGAPIKVTDANGKESTITYDSFGRVKSTKAPGEPTIQTNYVWCTGYYGSTGGCTQPGDENLVYYTYSRQAGYPTTYAGYDSLNRNLINVTIKFSGGLGYTTKQSFNARGLMDIESNVHDYADQSELHFTYYKDYDALGRVGRKETPQANTASGDPNGGTPLITTYNYSGLVTNITASHDGKTIGMARKYNGLGQLVWTQDANLAFTRYAYDGSGNPVAIEDAAGNTISTKFNALGHKLEVDDPNMGIKQFQYNSLGELEQEIDANGVLQTYTYDTLGRMTHRYADSVLTGQWTYDGTQGHHRIGMLNQEYNNNLSGNNDRLIKDYYYATTSSGKDFLSYVRNRLYEGGAFTDYLTYHYMDNNYGRPTGMRYGATDLRLKYEYNSFGYLTHIKNAASGYVYKEITEMDNLGNVTGSLLGDATLTQSQGFHSVTGQMLWNRATKQGMGKIHELDYDYAAFSNLEQSMVTVSNGASNFENYTYDNLHRLTQSERSYMSVSRANDIIDYAYDALGNFTYKSDYVQSYYYGNGNANGVTAKTSGGNAGPNAVRSIAKTDGSNTSYSYDNNGNMKTGDGRYINYNVFNKPVTISKGLVTNYFSYGADLLRYKQIKSGGAEGTVTTYYVDQMLEKEVTATKTTYRHYIGDFAILNKEVATGTSWKIAYNLKDRLGSVVTLADENGDVIEHRSFDPFGKPRTGDFAIDTQTIKEAIELDPHATSGNMDPHTNRGFTDHEHLDGVQLIHMNGRVYDYNLGRFTSVDPFVQAPTNSQSMNPYSYIMNNPLAGTDPSGYKTIWDRANCGGSESQCNAQLGQVLEKLGFAVNNGKVNLNSRRFTSEGGATQIGKMAEIKPGDSDYRDPSRLMANCGICRAQERDMMDLVHDRITQKEYNERIKYRAIGAGTGIVIAATVAAVGIATVVKEGGQMAVEEVTGIPLDMIPSVKNGIEALAKSRIKNSVAHGADDAIVKKLSDDALVVRGGAAPNHTADKINDAIGDHPEGVRGFSAQCNNGTCLESVGQNLRNNQVGVTTVGNIRSNGGDVVKTSGFGDHVTVTGISGENASTLLDVVKNPKPRR